MVKDKLFEAFVIEVLAKHVVKELISHIRLALQFRDFKAFNRLAIMNSIKLILNLIKDPRHRSCVNLRIVDFETLTFERLNLRCYNIMNIHNSNRP